jgi:hypothetical protein
MRMRIKDLLLLTPAALALSAASVMSLVFVFEALANGAYVRYGRMVTAASQPDAFWTQVALMSLCALVTGALAALCIWALPGARARPAAAVMEPQARA